MQFLGLQVFVGLMTAYAIVQFRERRHAQRGVIRGIYLPMVSQSIAHIHTRINLERHLVPRVLHGDEARRERELSQQDVMFQVEAQVRTVQSEGIVTFGSMDMNRCMQGFPEVPAHQVFIAELSTKGCAPANPVEIAVQVHSADIRPVIIILHQIRLTVIAFIAITTLVPIDGRMEMEGALLRLSLNGCVYLIGMLKLVISLPFRCGVRRTAAPPFRADSRMPADPQGIVFILSLVEQLTAFEASIQTTIL